MQNGRIRVGIMGASERTGLLRSLGAGFAGSGIEVVSLRDTECSFREAVRNVDVVQVTAWDTTRYWVLPALQARLMGKPVVRYWVGTDVLRLIQRRGDRRRARIANLIVQANIAQSHGLQEELRGLGISSHVLPAPHAAVVADPIDKLPERFTILGYVARTSHRWHLYGGDTLVRLAEQYPNWQFLLLNHTGEGVPTLPNVRYRPRVPPNEMNAIYCQASVLVRITQHDGLPRMILEALAWGLHVVWNQAFPYCYHARSHEELCRTLEILATERSVNQPGADFVRREYDPGVVAARWKHFYKQLIGGQ